MSTFKVTIVPSIKGLIYHASYSKTASESQLEEMRTLLQHMGAAWCMAKDTEFTFVQPKPAWQRTIPLNYRHSI